MPTLVYHRENPPMAVAQPVVLLHLQAPGVAAAVVAAAAASDYSDRNGFGQTFSK